MSLDASIRFERGRHTIDVSLKVATGSCLALFGPNGAGKTSVLWALAGLLEGVRGSIRVDDEVWLDGSVNRPPWRRNLGLVFQQRALFEHLDVLDNVAYGPRRRGATAADARARARTWLDRVGAGALADRRPGSLSGGEARRVSIARALAPEPGVLLLDEPLAGLDVGSRETMTELLRELVISFAGTAVWVAHSLDSVRDVAADLVVVEGGQVVESGAFEPTLDDARSDHLRAMRDT